MSWQCTCMVFTDDPLAPDWTINWRLLSGKEVWRPPGIHTYERYGGLINVYKAKKATCSCKCGFPSLFLLNRICIEAFNYKMIHIFFCLRKAWFAGSYRSKRTRSQMTMLYLFKCPNDTSWLLEIKTVKVILLYFVMSLSNYILK